MKPHLHIITQCTDRKLAKVERKHQLRNFTQKSLGVRCDAWCAALVAAPEEVRVRASDLYAGEHWVASLNARKAAERQGFRVSLWVASAGYGLLAEDEAIAPYSATFAKDAADSTLTSSSDFATQRRAWWTGLQGRFGRSLPALGGRDVRLLVILSPAYLQALADELMATREALGSSDQLVILSSQGPDAARSSLGSNVVLSSARVQTIVGGSRIGQHARVAHALLDAVPLGDFGLEACRSALEQMCEGVPEYAAPQRNPMTDHEVQAFIHSTGAGSWSRALRELRASGRACEQKRFRQLFMEVRSP